ncbi:hypothetical protein T11_15417 [Trichinella zimbabwensis]|uniref:Uncharacterized protein n=1 Tax=Trichinella zimbabwensis TaxID=268475 RepID=A0A0V1HPR4_9BILA|nr:hypothetical protein T11_15417 [Trichinella zimbabwensis]
MTCQLSLAHKSEGLMFILAIITKRRKKKEATVSRPVLEDQKKGYGGTRVLLVLCGFVLVLYGGGHYCYSLINIVLLLCVLNTGMLPTKRELGKRSGRAGSSRTDNVDAETNPQWKKLPLTAKCAVFSLLMFMLFDRLKPYHDRQQIAETWELGRKRRTTRRPAWLRDFICPGDVLYNEEEKEEGSYRKPTGT